MRIKYLHVNASLFLVLSAVIFKAIAAATATTKVTANIVPGSSFSLSESIRLSTVPEGNANVQQTLKNNNQIKISSLSNKTKVKVKINGDQNTIYDLSISSESILTGSSSSDTITITDMKMSNNLLSTTSGNEREMLIRTIPIKPENDNTGSYSGTIEITLNYN